MPIVGFHLNKISVERKERITGQVNVKSNLKITNVGEEKEVTEIAKDMKALKFEFEFTVDYEPNIAEVHFKGHILDLEKEEEAKKILKDWKQKKLDEDLRLRISNMIWFKCNVKSLLLEEEIGLPLHFPIPRLVK